MRRYLKSMEWTSTMSRQMFKLHFIIHNFLVGFDPSLEAGLQNFD